MVLSFIERQERLKWQKREARGHQLCGITEDLHYNDPALCDEILTYVDCRGFDMMIPTGNAADKSPIEFGHIWMEKCKEIWKETI